MVITSKTKLITKVSNESDISRVLGLPFVNLTIIIERYWFLKILIPLRDKILPAIFFPEFDMILTMN